jgi:hypothetical protein
MNVDTPREDDPDTQCGFGSFRPGFLQVGELLPRPSFCSKYGYFK